LIEKNNQIKGHSNPPH